MVSYEIYKFLHLIGIILMFSGLIGLLTMRTHNITPAGASKSFAFITHGIGLLLILVSGFGLLARLQLAQNMPNWAYFKIAIWLYFGMSIALVKRKGHLGWVIYLPLIIGFIAAAYLALWKPF